MSPNKIFMFLINPPRGNTKRQKLIAKHIVSLTSGNKYMYMSD